MDHKKFYITTSIAYINSEPHIGFALELVQADVLARYFRQKGFDVFFQTGADEHGSKIQRAAEAVQKNPQEFVDELSEKFEKLKPLLNLSWNNFIRTTDQNIHWPVVQDIWLRLFASGDLYKKKYGGYYCVGCEAFKTGRDIVNGKCVVHKKELEFIEEENWFFRLSKYTKEIELAIKSDKLKILPETRRNEILALLSEGLEDISFSRSKKQLKWGIPVPNDNDQVMYVWADALTNYISGYGGIEKWKEHPADVHVIGKDISRFHAAIWPAMLISASLPLPKNIFVHGFITSGGEKMSKSLGNIIDPYELVKKYGADPVRYYLLREIPSSGDGDFSYEKFEERYNGDLANGLGNFAARVLTLASREGVLSGKPRKDTENFSALVIKNIENFRFDIALNEIWNLIHYGDGYLNLTKPWSKDLPEKNRKEFLYDLVFMLKTVSDLLIPFLPETAEKISKAIEISGDGFISKKIDNLFPRLQ
ncbi:MAG: methionine--tRNA ligase [Patescibacteria group bacterium]|nr:methionine--tRNA ligase [Patescibacteria group bacterium]